MIKQFEDFEEEDLVPKDDLSNIPTLAQALSTFYEGQRVRIVLGHPANNQYIEGDVRGFEGKGAYPALELYILLENIKSNTHWLDDVIAEGRYSKHQICPNHQIEVV
jgi:hypothetical protein